VTEQLPTGEPAPSAPPPPTPRLTLWDFVVVLVAGLVGSVLGAVVVGPDASPAEIFGVLFGAQYGGHLLGLMVVLRRRRMTLADLGFEADISNLGYVGLGVVLQIALLVLMVPFAQLLGVDAESPQEIQNVISGELGTAGLIAAIITIALLGPVVEELMFRGVVLKALLVRWGRNAAIFGSAAAFAVLHLLGLDFTRLAVSAALTLPRFFIMGLVLAYLTLRKGTLGPAIFTHAGFNLIGVIVTFAAPLLS
jgi:membrane protease YdiL (CAAX protease family)